METSNALRALPRDTSRFRRLSPEQPTTLSPRPSLPEHPHIRRRTPVWGREIGESPAQVDDPSLDI